MSPTAPTQNVIENPSVTPPWEQEGFASAIPVQPDGRGWSEGAAPPTQPPAEGANFDCPSCQQHNWADAALLNSWVACFHCGEPVVTPAPQFHRGALSYRQALEPGSQAPPWPFEDPENQSPEVADAVLADDSHEQKRTTTEKDAEFDWEAACAEVESGSVCEGPLGDVVAMTTAPLPRESSGASHHEPIERPRLGKVHQTTVNKVIVEPPSVAQAMPTAFVNEPLVVPEPNAPPSMPQPTALEPEQEQASPTPLVPEAIFAQYIEPSSLPTAPAALVSPTWPAVSSQVPLPEMELEVDGSHLPTVSPALAPEALIESSEAEEAALSEAAAVREAYETSASQSSKQVPVAPQGPKDGAPWDLFAQRPPSIVTPAAKPQSEKKQPKATQDDEDEEEESARWRVKPQRRKHIVAIGAGLAACVVAFAVMQRLKAPARGSVVTENQLAAAVSSPVRMNSDMIGTSSQTESRDDRSQSEALSPDLLLDPVRMQIEINRDQAPPISLASRPERLPLYDAAKRAMAQLITGPDDVNRQLVLSGTDQGALPSGAWDVERVHHISTGQAPGADHMRTVFDAELNPGARAVRFVFKHTPAGPRMSRKLLLEQFAQDLEQFIKAPTSEPKTLFAQVSLKHAFDANSPDESHFLCLGLKSPSGRGVTAPVFVDLKSEVGQKISQYIKWGETYICSVELAAESAQPDRGAPQAFTGLRQLISIE